jgi:hypothetical protein
MKLSFGSLNVIVERRLPEDRFPTLQDVKYVNDETLYYLRNLSEEEIMDRIRPLICSIEQGSQEAEKILEDKGIVVIPDFVPKKMLGKISQDLDEIRQEVSKFIISGRSVQEEERVLFQQGGAKLSGYDALSNFNKSVVQIRHGQDQGMIDIFNVDKWKVSLGKILRTQFQNKDISKLMNAEKVRVQPRNLNLYMNQDVTSTRGFHVDSYIKQLKGFIYLEDCLTLDDGPYTYVAESQIESPLVRLNKLISAALPNKTETPLVSFSKVTPILAKKGALVISDQGGSHRGFPQTLGHQRTVAVMNFG